MTEPVTDAEILFLALLDEWALVLPDQEHIDSELREVYLPRALKQMTMGQLKKSLGIAHHVIDDFIKLADVAVVGSLGGAIRDSWVLSMRDILGEFQFVMDVLYNEIDGRVH